METLLGIAILAGIVVIIILWGKASSAMGKKVNQSVLFRRQHANGQSATQSRLTFETLRGPAEIIAAVEAKLNLPKGVSSTVLGRLYVAASDDDGIVIESGSKLGRSFRSQLLLNPRPGGGTAGIYTVTNWKVSDGIVSDIEQMTILSRKIREAMVELDQSVSFTS